MSRKALHIWTIEEKEYLKEITPGRHHREIADLMSLKFGTDFTVDRIKNAINRYKLNTGFNGQFMKGCIPPNKGKKGIGGWKPTQFKKGNIPVNHKEVGSERITIDGYTEVKVAEPNKWRLKHRMIWEEHHGSIPKGYAVIFADKNQQNFDIHNLMLLNRSQLLILNRYGLIKENAELTKMGLIIADIHLKINELRKSNS